jgi:hypothetical protein
MSVKLHYIAPDGHHSLTPVAVRERYVREVTDASLVVWRSAAAGRFGFRAGIDELAWDVSKMGSIELTFCRPAKGAGEILLYVHEQPAARLELALSSNRFEPGLLDWFRPVLTILNLMFPQRVTERDHGYDA